ncbi:hypothetical protein GCM10009579_73290 [Streptomyces javensis]|uniref:Integral membrane protein n=1 Tax=Streptomyces javensis TaxID=114698 RepID=A0ABN1XAC4_9ACTN
MLWLACIAAASATMGGHRPSEVLGAALLACAYYGLATWLLPPAAAPGATRSTRALPVTTSTVALAIALVSGARNDTLTRSLVSAATAFICAAPAWCAAVGRPGRLRSLRAGREPWLAVDPKGYVGDPAYDGGVLLKSRALTLLEADDLRKAVHRVLDVFAEAAELDRELAQRWGPPRRRRGPLRPWLLSAPGTGSSQ